MMMMMTMMTMNMIVLVLWKARTQMATPKWFLVALSQCQPGQIAAADLADDDEYDGDDDENGDHDYVLHADVVDDETDYPMWSFDRKLRNIALIECR